MQLKYRNSLFLFPLISITALALGLVLASCSPYIGGPKEEEAAKAAGVDPEFIRACSSPQKSESGLISELQRTSGETNCYRLGTWVAEASELDLSQKSITSLRPISWVTKMRLLSVRANPITDFGTWRPGLTEMDLSQTAVRNETLRQLPTTLRRLSLRGSGVSDLYSLTLFLRNLEELDLSDSSITGDSLGALSGLANLQTLHLSSGQILIMKAQIDVLQNLRSQLKITATPMIFK